MASAIVPMSRLHMNVKVEGAVDADYHQGLKGGRMVKLLAYHKKL